MKTKHHVNTLLGCAVVAASLMGSAAWAAKNQVTFVSQGGAWQDAQEKAILDPITDQLGIKVMQDSAPDAWPMIKTQGSTGQAVWDVVDTPPLNCIRGGRQGFIETLDFSEMPYADEMPDTYKTPYSVAYEFYSSVLAYNKDGLKKYPNSWAEFWDVEHFPGKRALRNHPLATLEAALMADGVKPDELYPLDVDRAFAKLEEIKPYITTWWTSGGQSAQLLFDGEVDMLMMWNGRVKAAKEAGANAEMTYNDGILQATHLCIIKDSPNPETAKTFLNAAISPELQANLPQYIAYGPGNPAAFATGKISDDIAKGLPSAPANAKVQAMMSYEWWASEEGEAAERRWLEFMQK